MLSINLFHDELLSSTHSFTLKLSLPLSLSVSPYLTISYFPHSLFLQPSLLLSLLSLLIHVISLCVQLVITGSFDYFLKV